MRYLLTIGHNRFVLPPGTKVEPILAALSKSISVSRTFGIKRLPGDCRDFYKPEARPVEIAVAAITDEQLVVTKEVDGEEVIDESAVIITPDPSRRRRLHASRPLLPSPSSTH